MATSLDNASFIDYRDVYTKISHSKSVNNQISWNNTIEQSILEAIMHNNEIIINHNNHQTCTITKYLVTIFYSIVEIHVSFFKSKKQKLARLMLRWEIIYTVGRMNMKHHNCWQNLEAQRFIKAPARDSRTKLTSTVKCTNRPTCQLYCINHTPMLLELREGASTFQQQHRSKSQTHKCQSKQLLINNWLYYETCLMHFICTCFTEFGL